MLIVLSDGRLSDQDLRQFTTPIVPDSLQRLHRFYGVSTPFPFSDLTTFVLDFDWIYRFAFDHTVDSMDCEILRGVLVRTSRTPMRNDDSRHQLRRYLMNCAHSNDSPILEMCGCGRVYLTYGPVTVAFKYAEFVKFARNVMRLADTAIEKLGTRVLADTHRTH